MFKLIEKMCLKIFVTGNDVLKPSKTIVALYNKVLNLNRACVYSLIIKKWILIINKIL